MMLIFSSVLKFSLKKGIRTPNRGVRKPKKTQKSVISGDNFWNFGVPGNCLKIGGEYTFGFFSIRNLLVETEMKIGCYENV